MKPNPRYLLIGFALSLAIGAATPSMVPAIAPALALADDTPKPRNPDDVAGMQMEWNTGDAPSYEISALSEECEKHFPGGKTHTCDVFSRSRKKTDVILGSDFGRRGKIYCRMEVQGAHLKHPERLPWLTAAQMEKLFEAGTVTTRPWSCALRKCDADSGECKKLGQDKIIAESIPGL